jgi:hypothetical protein
MKRFWLEALSISAVFVLLAGSAWTNVITPAREAARRTQCKNNLRISCGGCPIGDRVTLDPSGKVDFVVVGLDLMDSTPRATMAPIAYHRFDGTPIDEAELPIETVFEARVMLLSYKTTPEWDEQPIFFRSRRSSLTAATKLTILRLHLADSSARSCHEPGLSGVVVEYGWFCWAQTIPSK